MKWKIAILIFITAGVALGLTPAERQFAVKARQYLAAAKAKVDHNDQVLAEESRRAQQAEQTVAQQSSQIGTLSGQIETAHKNEQAAVEFNKYSKPIIDQVNSYWGLGAFLYGFKILARHLLILIAVLAVVALIVFGLSFVFPAIIPFIRMVGSFLASIFRSIGNLFRKK